MAKPRVRKSRTANSPAREKKSSPRRSEGRAGLNVRWFQDRMDQLGLSQRKLAARVNIHHVLVSRLLAGKRKFSLEDATAFARVFQVPLEEVVLHAGISSVAELNEAPGGEDRIAIKGWVDGDLRIHWEAPRALKWAPNYESTGKHVQVVRFQTGGTKLDAFDGALAYFRPSGGVSVDAIGRQCVVKLRGDGENYGSRICVVKRGYLPSTYNLLQLNGELMVENAVVEACSPIVRLEFQ